MTASVEPLWQRIVAFLSEYAPATAREIRPPAPAEQVRRLRDVVGLDLPADLLAWWAVMDGIDDHRDGPWNRAGGLIPDAFVPLSVTRAEEEYARQSRFPDEGCCTAENTHRKQAGETGFPYCTALIPICIDIGGELLCVDLREGDDHGRVMEWTAEEGFYPSAWAGVTEILDEIVERLDNYVRGLEPPHRENHPVIEDGALIWS